MLRCWKVLFMVIGLTSICLWSSAQRPAPGRSPDESSPGPEFGHLFSSDDTLDVKYYYLSAPSQVFTYQDTFVRYFHEYDINHIKSEQYLNLGFPGSPVRPVIPIPVAVVGYHPGYNAYRPYQVNNHNYRFYYLRKAITYASYFQGQTQNDGIFRAFFARDFKDGLQFTLDYHRINNTGIYLRQGGQNTMLGMGLRYLSKNKRWQVHATHYANTFAQENNGGVATDSLFANPLFEDRVAIPIQLNAAQTRDQQRVFQLSSNYRLIGGKDSTNFSQGIIAQFQLKSDNWLFKYSDPEAPLQYYGAFVTHVEGIRNFVGVKRQSAHFNLLFGGKRPDQQFKVGIQHIGQKIDLDLTTDRINDWILDGSLKWSLKETIRAHAFAQLGSNDLGNSYLLGGDLAIDLKKAGVLTGYIHINQRLPSLVETRLILSQAEVWQKDFKNVLNNHLRVKYAIPAAKFEVSGGQVVTSNPIFFSTDGRPEQLDELASLSYLSAYKAIERGRFLTEHKIILQTSSNADVFRVPSWYSIHGVYFSGQLFKKVLNMKTGVQITLNDSYAGMTFAPFIGQFVLAKDDIDFYPSIDYHLSFRVKFFRAALLLENLLQPIRNDVYFQTSRYPRQDLTLRLGISWLFIN